MQSSLPTPETGIIIILAATALLSAVVYTVSLTGILFYSFISKKNSVFFRFLYRLPLYCVLIFIVDVVTDIALQRGVRFGFPDYLIQTGCEEISVALTAGFIRESLFTFLFIFRIRRAPLVTRINWTAGVTFLALTLADFFRYRAAPLLATWMTPEEFLTMVRTFIVLFTVVALMVTFLVRSQRSAIVPLGKTFHFLWLVVGILTLIIGFRLLVTFVIELKISIFYESILWIALYTALTVWTIRLSFYLFSGVRKQQVASRGPEAGTRFNLTERETQVLKQLVQGYSLKEISVNLDIAYNTARNHSSSIYKKCGVNSRIQLIREFDKLKNNPGPHGDGKNETVGTRPEAALQAQGT